MNEIMDALQRHPLPAAAIALTLIICCGLLGRAGRKED